MHKLKLLIQSIFFFTILVIPKISYSEEAITLPLSENALHYEIKKDFLLKGNFQYFFSLLKEEESEDNPEIKFFKNLINDDCRTKTKEIVDTFMPLDINGIWDSKDHNYLAVAKMNYILPVGIDKIDEKKINNVNYLQKTMPNYKVTQTENFYFVDGSLLTPAFNLYLNFLTPKHPNLALVKDIDPKKVKAGRMKVSYQHQDEFGRVMMVRTAKMASAMTIYEDYGPKKTLVTQYIFSNVINVPTKNMIKNGMVENMQNVVKGSRIAVLDF